MTGQADHPFPGTAGRACRGACVLADGHGRVIAFDLAPGQAHERPMAAGLVKALLGPPKWIVADRGYSSL